MKYLARKIRQIISGSTQTLIHRKRHPFDYIQTRKGILRELMISKQSGNLVGLISPALGEGIFLILVLYVESQNADEVIAFQKYDVSAGRTCSAARITINDIQGVCSFVTNHHDSSQFKPSFRIR